MTSPTIAIREERPIRNILLAAIIIVLFVIGVYGIFFRSSGVSTDKVNSLISAERDRLGVTINKDGYVVIKPDGLINQTIIGRLAEERARLGYKTNDDGTVSVDPNGIIMQNINAATGDIPRFTPDMINCIIDVTETERETGTDLDPAASCANK